MCVREREGRKGRAEAGRHGIAVLGSCVGPQLVDPRVVYQLVLFAHQRGAAQFQGEQLLKFLEAFEGCQITDSKAWARLGELLRLLLLRLLQLMLQLLMDMLLQAPLQPFLLQLFYFCSNVCGRDIPVADAVAGSSVASGMRKLQLTERRTWLLTWI